MPDKSLRCVTYNGRKSEVSRNTGRAVKSTLMKGEDTESSPIEGRERFVIYAGRQQIPDLLLTNSSRTPEGTWADVYKRDLQTPVFVYERSEYLSQS